MEDEELEELFPGELYPLYIEKEYTVLPPPPFDLEEED